MSENREDDAQEGGSRIEELPASDSDLGGEEQASRGVIPDQGSGLRSPSPDPDDAAARSSPSPGDPDDAV